MEAIFLAPKSCGFDVLDFELNAFGGYGGDVYVEVISHKIIWLLRLRDEVKLALHTIHIVFINLIFLSTLIY